MMAFAAVSAEIVATIAVLALTNLAILAIRNPHRSDRLRSSGVQTAIEMITISAVLVIVPMLGAGIFAVLPNLWLGTTAFLGLVIGIYVGLDQMMQMERRLKLCDAGGSPFAGGKPPVMRAPAN